jgi:hypothetical protein
MFIHDSEMTFISQETSGRMTRMASIPTHAQWKKFKTDNAIGANMVSSVNVGKSLDTYHNKMSRDFKANAKLANDLAKNLAIYLNKFPDKKGTHKAFLAEFEKKYLNAAKENAEEFATMAGSIETYSARVQQLMAVSAKLRPGMPVDVLQKLRQGPIRGVLAAGTQVKGYDSNGMKLIWKPLEEEINDMGVTSTQTEIDTMIAKLHRAATATLTHGNNTQLF